jgi:hypothetical protein
MVTRRMPLVEQELLTLLWKLNFILALSGVIGALPLESSISACLFFNLRLLITFLLSSNLFSYWISLVKNVLSRLHNISTALSLSRCVFRGRITRVVV